MDSSFHKQSIVNDEQLNTNHNPIEDVNNDDDMDENMDLDSLLRDIGHSD